MNLSTSKTTTNHGSNMSKTKINAAEQEATKKVFRHADGTFRKADRHESMSDNDWDIVNSYTERNAKRQDWRDADDRDSEATYKSYSLIRKGFITLYADFQIDTSNNSARIATYSNMSSTTYRTYSLDEARKMYAIMRKRGYTTHLNF